MKAKTDKIADPYSLTLQMMMTLLQLGHKADIYSFISTSINPIATKFDRTAD